MVEANVEAGRVMLTFATARCEQCITHPSIPDPLMERILKLTPGRAGRRLMLLHKSGLVDLNDFMVHLGYSLEPLVRWGLLECMPSPHSLDAYGGYRPTRKGRKHFLLDEAYHLLVVRKKSADALHARYRDELEILHDAAWANFGLELRSGLERGLKYEPLDPVHEARRDRVIANYERRGYLRLDRFMTSHGISTDELIVAGVLRYTDRRSPDRIALLVVGAKAKDCLLLSTRWQLILVKPGMEADLLKRCAIRSS